jgi:hypothetical protein
MLIRFIKHFITAAVLVGVGGTAVSIGLPETGVLTPLWGWVLTGVGIAAIVVAIPLAVRNARLFKKENIEIESRQPFINEMRQCLEDVEMQIEDISKDVEQVPLHDYEEKYLSKYDGYEVFKKRYINEQDATESDAQYVALGVHYGLNDNPLFNDSLKSSPYQLYCTPVSQEVTKIVGWAL